MRHPDVCIAGAGIIGLSIALELHRLGLSVVVLERGLALTQASTAAAGMLAANDPDLPSPLTPLAALSLSLYPDFLAQIEALSRHAVPIQTTCTLQSVHAPVHPVPLLPAFLDAGDLHFLRLQEQSIDPRQLATALLAAIRNTSIDLREHTALLSSHPVSQDSIQIETSTGSLEAGNLIETIGAWSPHRISPRKGQMLLVDLPASLPLREVIRTPDIYIVPRLIGPNAGRALIGATIEDAGFDLSTHVDDLAALQARATALLPDLASAPHVASWAGLRSVSQDLLPFLGHLAGRPRHLLATGHFRNGILLAPATAHLISQLLLRSAASIDITPFCPNRLS